MTNPLINPLILGLDSGGSGTTWALADATGQIHDLQHGPTLMPTQAPDWQARLAAMLPKTALAAAVLGLPVHGEIASYSAAQTRAAHALIGPQAMVCNDVQIAHTGAFAGGSGVLILAGTGSMAWASNGAKRHRVGGWGELLGDEGSGYWIGAQALNRLTHCLDHRMEDAAFAAGMLSAIGTNAAGLPDWAYGQADFRGAVAALAPAVTALAATATGSAIITEAANHLARHIATAQQLIGLYPLQWSHAGGVFTCKLLLTRLQSRLATQPIKPILPPLGGALWQAATNAGWAPDATFIKTLAAELSDKDPP